jgi:hypothetical protein
MQRMEDILSRAVKRKTMPIPCFWVKLIDLLINVKVRVNYVILKMSCFKILFIGTCSHRFVSDIYAATISSNITACPCSQSEAQTKLLHRCTTPTQKSGCENETLVGEPIMNTYEQLDELRTF